MTVSQLSKGFRTAYGEGVGKNCSRAVPKRTLLGDKSELRRRTISGNRGQMSPAYLPGDPVRWERCEDSGGLWGPSGSFLTGRWTGSPAS